MDKNKFVLIKERGGISNRILNLVGGILYAKITQRCLIVDWSDEAYSRDRSNIFPLLFDLQGVEQSTEIPITSSVHPKVWRERLDYTVEEVLIEQGVDNSENLIVRNPVFWSRYRTDVSKIDFKQVVLVKWTYFAEIHKLRRYFAGEFRYLNDLDDKAILKKLILNHLQLKPLVDERIQLFKEKYFFNNVIGIHIRFTDRKNPYGKYPSMISEILKDDPHAQIFLATDNWSVQQDFKDLFGSRVIVAEKWFPESVSSQSNYYNRLHVNPDCPDMLENAIHALVDLYTLASCNYLICDQNSTFAYVAELLSPIPAEKVIDTSRDDFKRKLRTFVHFLERWF